MGRWSDYPDGSDYNIDVFANVIQRYFMKSEDSDYEITYDDEDECDPGLNIRMNMRMGGTPVFNDDDLTDEAMNIYLEILKIYEGNIDDSQIVGLAISLARVIDNQPFGIFAEGSKELPKVNLLRKDINDFIFSLAESSEFINEEVKKNILVFFS